MRFWNMKEGRCVAVVSSGSQKISGMASMMAGYFVAIQDDHDVVLWDVGQRKVLRRGSASHKTRRWPLGQVAALNVNIFACLYGDRALLYDARSMEQTIEGAVQGEF